MVRIAVNDYKIPDTELVIPKGTKLFIPVDAIQTDPDIYPDPEIFDPERFDTEITRSRHPMTWLPFGEGPRNCIGFRFGKMQAKVGLARLLLNYRFEPSEKTVALIPSPNHGLNTSNDGLFLKVTKL